jgi:hypothetical protein
MFDLIDADPVLGHLLLRYPGTLIPGKPRRRKFCAMVN